MSIRKFGKKTRKIIDSTYEDMRRAFNDLRKKFIDSNDDKTLTPDKSCSKAGKDIPENEPFRSIDDRKMLSKRRMGATKTCKRQQPSNLVKRTSDASVVGSRSSGKDSMISVNTDGLSWSSFVLSPKDKICSEEYRKENLRLLDLKSANVRPSTEEEDKVSGSRDSPSLANNFCESSSEDLGSSGENSILTEIHNENGVFKDLFGECRKHMDVERSLVEDSKVGTSGSSSCQGENRHQMRNITFRRGRRKLSIEVGNLGSLRPPTFRVKGISIRTPDKSIGSRQLCEVESLRRVPFCEMPSDVRKIGEATFSEVFSHGSLVYKIIPLGSSSEETSFPDFLREASIFRIISGEEGVCKLKDAFVAVGRYSEEYLKAWDEYGEEENERPCKYGEEQEYGVLVMEDGGKSLEDCEFCSLEDVDKFIRDIIRVLANLEDKYEFEHRDLHWGNILIKDGRVNLIDFSLSRLMRNCRVIYNDLNSRQWLFEGDESIDIQFGVYREMLKLCSGSWSLFTPQSNVMWLRYVIDKAFGKNRFKGKKSLMARYMSMIDGSMSVSEIERKLTACK